MPLGGYLSDKSIGVLVRAPLPRAIWIAEEDIDICCHSKLLMRRHLKPSNRPMELMDSPRYHLSQMSDFCYP